MNVLITGGAGFIGSHLADQLVGRGHRVRALDLLTPQVHGQDAVRPEYLNRDVELMQGDVRDAAQVRKALKGIDAVYHFAAAVGVGQSMYRIVDYTMTNHVGTAVLLEAIVERPIKRLVVASSMSVYGEGYYQRKDGTRCAVWPRPARQLERHEWEVRDGDSSVLTPIPTTEQKATSPTSVYALSKYDQEQLCLLIGQAYSIPTVALRFFNVYGPRQSLSNPYTGVMAIFASRLLGKRRPLIFEDGQQLRDFVSVHDVINVGSGRAISIRELAHQLGEAIGHPDIEPEITGEYRSGDVRHCFADIAKAKQLLGYEPRVELSEGLKELAEWLEDQVVIDQVDEARRELSARGLTL
jgi:dTDP-L-rhamnose 4-epimerase